MASAGWCRECQANVWLCADGGCANGHLAESITGAYDAGPRPLPIAQGDPASDAKRRRRVVIISLGIVFAVLLVCAGAAALVDMSLNQLAADLDSGWVVPGEPEPYSSPDWAAAVSCPPGGTASFDAEVISTSLGTDWGLPLVYVETPASGAGTAGSVVVEVKIPMDAKLRDASGAIVPRPEFLELLEDLPSVTIEVEDISGQAWATRIQLRQ